MINNSKSFAQSIEELRQMANAKGDSFEEIGAAIIGFMFGIPTEMAQQAIDEMKQKQEVKDIINRYKKCHEDI